MGERSERAVDHRSVGSTVLGGGVVGGGVNDVTKVTSSIVSSVALLTSAAA